MSTSSYTPLNVKKTLKIQNTDYTYYSLPDAANLLGKDISRLPFSMKILLENLLRYEDGKTVSRSDIETIASWAATKSSGQEIAYRPARVLMQDFTGVPAVVDLAAMRDAIKKLDGDPKKINPLSPVDMVIDHSISVDFFGSDTAFDDNVSTEMKRNQERYEFLRWGQEAFDNFRVVPPGTGICHQVNLEYLAQVVWTKQQDGETIAYPDTLVGTDSHTTMVNGLAVLGWGVGGIEAEAAMLGQPISMLLPEVIGFRLTGKPQEGVTTTDIVLRVTEMLRAKGVVGKFVEFCGDGVDTLSLADRSTIANMAPEYGATCGFFPIDAETIRYLKLSSRDAERIELVEAYAKAQGMWQEADGNEPEFTDVLTLELSTVEPSIAGPKRPQDRIVLSQASRSFINDLSALSGNPEASIETSYNVNGQDYTLSHGDIAIAAITSCTNTSNPSVMIAAGLVAKKAREKGLTVPPWVKTSLAPGSQVVTEYLESGGLQDDLDALGFQLVGYGCTTCIGNSGPLKPEIEESIQDNKLVVTSVLSGNRNFEGRVHPHVKANYLASPPLVVAYALAGSIKVNLTTDPIGIDHDGNYIHLHDIWPTAQEVSDYIAEHLTPKTFSSKYADVFRGNDAWRAIPASSDLTYPWKQSTYINNPPYFKHMQDHDGTISNIENASVLALLGDSITTDHISPAGSIAKDTPAAKFLKEQGVQESDFNSYGSRRGNHEIMMRGTFANIRIRNEMAEGKEGGYTKHIPTNDITSIYDASMQYQEANTPLVVIAGKEYGTGSSRDWAAKGTMLLGIKAVIAESFERIHRSNLVGMGVIPFMFKDGVTRQSLNLDGSETVSITGLNGKITPRMDVNCTITRKDGSQETITLCCRIDTENEIEYVQNGGILHYVIRGLMEQKEPVPA